MVKKGIGLYFSYGLYVQAKDSRRRVLLVRDLCPNKQKAEAFCKTLNALAPSPIHIEEILEDFLMECI